MNGKPIARVEPDPDRQSGGTGAEKHPVLALAGNGEEAFANRVRELHGPLLQTAVSYLRNRDAAEEVVQETWIAAIRGLSGFKGKSSFRSWIFVILLNHTKQKLKGERRRKQLLGSALKDGRVETDPVTTAVSQHGAPSSHFTPERLFLAGESGEALRNALATLPAKQQAVLRLRDIEGYTPKEVCSSLGLTPGAERVLHSRARSRLRRLLGPYLKKRVR